MAITVLTDTPGREPNNLDELYAVENLIPSCRVKDCRRDCGYVFASAAEAHHLWPDTPNLTLRWGQGPGSEMTLPYDWMVWTIALSVLFCFSFTIFYALYNITSVRQSLTWMAQKLTGAAGGLKSTVARLVPAVASLPEVYAKNTMDAAYLEARDEGIIRRERAKWRQEEEARTQEREQVHMTFVDKLNHQHQCELTGTRHSLRAYFREQGYQEERGQTVKKHYLEMTAIKAERDKSNRLAKSRGERLEKLQQVLLKSEIGKAMAETEKAKEELTALKVSSMKEKVDLQKATDDLRLELSEANTSHATDKAHWKAEKLAFEQAALQSTQQGLSADQRDVQQKRLLEDVKFSMQATFDEGLVDLREDLEKAKHEQDEAIKMYNDLRNNQAPDRSGEILLLRNEVLKLNGEVNQLQVQLKSVVEEAKAAIERKRIETEQLRVEYNNVQLERNNAVSERNSALSESNNLRHEHSQKIRDLNMQHLSEKMTLNREKFELRDVSFPAMTNRCRVK